MVSKVVRLPSRSFKLKTLAASIPFGRVEPICSRPFLPMAKMAAGWPLLWVNFSTKPLCRLRPNSTDPT
ncbi:hypothetical protein D3C72_2284040 [compost metagenome]